MLATTVIGQTTTPNLKGYGFAGGRYTHAVIEKSAALGTIGFLTHVSGALYTASYVDVGSYGKINNDWILLTPVQPASNFYVGLLAGPDADFTAYGDDVISYLTGSGGIMAAWQAKTKVIGFDKPGIWMMAKYNFKFDNAVTYYNGWTAGIGVFLPWGI